MRKSILFALASFAITSVIHAQIPKGSLFLGGGFSLFNRKTENSFTGADVKSQSQVIYPAVGIAIRQNTIVGLGFSYVFYKSTEGSNTQSKNSSYGINTFLRKYLLLGKNFYLFGEGTLGYDKGETNIYTNSTKSFEEKRNQFYMSFAPGIAYSVSKRFHLEAGMNKLLQFNYLISKSKNLITQSDGETNKQFTASTSLSTATPLTIGFRFVFSK